MPKTPRRQRGGFNGVLQKVLPSRSPTFGSAAAQSSCRFTSDGITSPCSWYSSLSAELGSVAFLIFDRLLYVLSRKHRMRIFVSSTFEDLREHRAAAIRVLRQHGHEVLAMEDLVALSAAPLTKVLEMVDRSEA